MSASLQKLKSVGKKVTPRGAELSELVLSTAKVIAEIVGSTLGPSGMQVLIERYEDLPPIITKDGVTVFRAIGFVDATRQVIVEAMRDASVRTAQEAGDGTTTATILAEAIIRHIHSFCQQNPQARPQVITRRFIWLFQNVIEPALRERCVKPQLHEENGRNALRIVAKVSANGDDQLADAVMQAFEMVGDEGNVTITEANGSSGYLVEQIKGYPITVGYEDSCGKWASKFINDPGTQTSRIENPLFLLYHGVVSDLFTIAPVMEKVFDAISSGELKSQGVVLVATGFSDSLLAQLGVGFQTEGMLKIFPLTIPRSPINNFGIQFLDDIAAITGAKVFDPAGNPLANAQLEDLGPGVQMQDVDGIQTACGVRSFEAARYRSNIIGSAAELGGDWEEEWLYRVDVVKQQHLTAESEFDRLMLGERLGKISGGIAKIVVRGSSNGELKERKDRVDDAVCAVRGAIKYGYLPGGAWGTVFAASIIDQLQAREPEDEVLVEALLAPAQKLLTNAGHTEQSAFANSCKMMKSQKGFNLNTGRLLDSPLEEEVLDSAPAVIESLKNAISISTLLGTLGGAIVFHRDGDLERREASNHIALQKEMEKLDNE